MPGKNDAIASVVYILQSYIALVYVTKVLIVSRDIIIFLRIRTIIFRY